MLNTLILDSPLLQLRNVSVQRGDRLALDSIDLRIDQGEHVAILGPNGSGKSTLIKLITRECYPLANAGSSFEILGRSSWNIFELRSHLGIVSNDLMARCTRDITGRELVLSGFFGSIGVWPNHHILPAMEQAARIAMQRLDVAHLADRWLDEVSSGEARRLLIARALIHNPSTLLLDEPATSLDLAALRELREHMSALAQSGFSLLLVTHHLEEIIPEIDRIVLLRGGSIFDDGPKTGILTARKLSSLFAVPVQVTTENGIYRAW
jgi:iron complex transport system ATP-binding protein